MKEGRCGTNVRDRKAKDNKRRLYLIVGLLSTLLRNYLYSSPQIVDGRHLSTYFCEQLLKSDIIPAAEDKQFTMSYFPRGRSPQLGSLGAPIFSAVELVT